MTYLVHALEAITIAALCAMYLLARRERKAKEKLIGQNTETEAPQEPGEAEIQQEIARCKFEAEVSEWEPRRSFYTARAAGQRRRLDEIRLKKRVDELEGR